MAYQAKELFKLFGAILNNDEIAKLEPETELTEEQFEAIQEAAKGLMTKEAVLNNAEIAEHFKKELYPVHKKSALSEVEEKLKPLAQKLGIDTTGKFASDLIDMLNDPIETALASKGDPKTKELLESYKKDLETLRAENEQVKTLAEQEREKLLSEFQRKELTGAIKSKINSYEWADSYKDDLVKSALVDRIVSEIQSKAHLKLEDGQIGVYQKDLPEKELFDGNKKITFQNLADSLVEPFTKKSAPVQNVVVQNPSNSKQDFRQQHRQRILEQTQKQLT